jgi:DNA-binding winged helix-turn-helix (wHTH) protein
MNGGEGNRALQHGFRLGRWEVEPDLGRLRCRKTEVYLRPQLLQVLAVLAEHQGGLVSSQELIERVWARRFVSPAALNRCIADLRRALGDTAQTPAYIETRRKRGYRITACVQPLGLASVPKEAPVFEVDELVVEEPVVTGWRNVFVGRDAELTRLGRRLRRTIENAGGVIFITGEPGSGKSALLKEFGRRATASHRDLLIVSGRGNAHDRLGEPLGLFRALLSLLTGEVQSRTGTGDLEPEQADRLWRHAPYVIELVLDLAPVLVGAFLPAGPLIERAKAVGLDAQTCQRLSQLVQERARSLPSGWPRQEQLTGQISEILIKVASRCPLVLLLDDLQWCDSASCAVIFHLAQERPQTRLLLVGAYRPGEVMDRESPKSPFGELTTVLSSQGDVEAVNLGLAAGRGFVNAFVDAEPNRLDATFRARFTQYTGGTALLTAELLRALQETGMVARDADGRWCAKPELDWAQIPGRLEPVIAQRMGRLPQRLRQLLKVAAVEGDEFAAEVVAAVLGRDTLHVIEDLGAILDRGHHLVVPLGVERLGPSRRSTYRFRHTFFQGWLESQLDSGERALLHERVGLALEHLYPGCRAQFAAQLARHFEAAGLAAKAIACYREAAQQATLLTADQEALRLLRSGLSLIDQLAAGIERDRSELEFQLAVGFGLIALRGYAASEVENCLTRIRALCHQTGEQAQVFFMLTQYHQFAGLRAEFGPALQAAEEMIALAEHLPDPNALAFAFVARGWLSLLVGRFTGALADPGRGTALKGTPRELAVLYGVEPRATALLWSSWGHWFRAETTAARECCARSIALARESGHPFSLAQSLGVGGALLHSFLEEPEETLRLTDEVEAIAARHGFPFYSAAVHIYRGSAHLQQGLYRRSVGAPQACGPIIPISWP